jgi:hypothetical protein
MQPINFWFFIWRSLGRATVDTTEFFGLDIKTIITTTLLLGCGFFLQWKIRGASETKDEIYKFAIATAMPFVLFVSALFLYNVFRAPYLVYVAEFSKIKQKFSDAETAKSIAESAKQVADARVVDLEGQLAKKECHGLVRPVIIQPPSEPAVVLGLTLADQKRIPSTYPEAKFGWQATIQTNTSIQPISLLVECSGDVYRGEFALSRYNGLAGMNSGVLAENKHIFRIDLNSPAFTPDLPIIVKLYSKEDIRIIKVSKVP